MFEIGNPFELFRWFLPQQQVDIVIAKELAVED